MGTEIFLFERDLLKEQRDRLYREFNYAIDDIQKSSNMDITTKMEVLGILANRLDEIVKKYPVIKNIEVNLEDK